ncbi:MAG: hypothetical protein ACKO37_09865 [Vampirovibrionales bacterium]
MTSFDFKTMMPSLFNTLGIRIATLGLGALGIAGIGEFAWIQTTPEHAMAQMLLALKHQNMAEFQQVVDTKRVIDTGLQGMHTDHPILGGLLKLGAGGLRPMLENKIQNTVESGTQGTEALPDASWLIASAFKFLPDTPFYTFKLQPVKGSSVEVMQGSLAVKGQTLNVTFEKAGMLGSWKIVGMDMPARSNTETTSSQS